MSSRRASPRSAKPAQPPEAAQSADERRRAALARLEAPDADLEALLDAAAELGALGLDRHAARLARLADDAATPAVTRAAAAAALGPGAPPSAAWLALVARAALTGATSELARRLAEHGPPALAAAETARAALDLSAAAVLGPLAAHAELAPLHGDLVHALAAERSLAALLALEALRDETPSHEAAAEARAALRTAWASREGGLQGTVWLSTCDGSGRYLLAVTTPQAVGSLVLILPPEAQPAPSRPAAPPAPPPPATVLFGAFQRQPAEPDVELASQLAALPGVELTRAPPQLVADLAHTAARTRPGRHAPEIRSTLSLVERLAATSGPADWPSVPVRRGRIPHPEVQALTSRPPLASWRAAPPPASHLPILSDHMALWSSLAGREDDAALWAALARAARRSPADHPLLSALQKPSPGPAAFHTDPDIRRHLRETFQAEVLVPTAADLARLDFAEAAALTLDLPQARLSTAWALGKAYANHFLASPRGEAPARRLLRHAADVLGSEAARAAELHEALEHFARDVCGACALACLRHPRAEVGATFTADSHPASPR